MSTFYKFNAKDKSGTLLLNKNLISSIKQISTGETAIKMNNGDVISVDNSVEQVLRILGESEEKSSSQKFV